MAKAISERHGALAYAPQVVTVKIDSDQDRLIIARAARHRRLEEGVRLQDRHRGGRLFVRSTPERGDGEGAATHQEMTRPISVGTVYSDRKVVNTAEFGAFIELRKGTDGLLHASRSRPACSSTRSTRCSRARHRHVEDYGG